MGVGCHEGLKAAPSPYNLSPDHATLSMKIKAIGPSGNCNVPSLGPLPFLKNSAIVYWVNICRENKKKIRLCTVKYLLIHE